jgi:Asp-tRNA(Asn)/Glu-tRNA(Gln) amidotransferase A subunit family amidase
MCSPTPPTTTTRANRGIPLAVAVTGALLSLLFGLGYRVTSLRRTLFLPEQHLNATQKREALLKFVFDGPYDVEDVEAPILSGIVLSKISRILVSFPLGDWIVRFLMEQNGIPTLIELALALQATTGERTSGGEWGLSDPLVRLSTDDYAWHVAAASSDAATTKDPQRSLTPPSPPFDRATERQQYRSVQDFYNAYQSKTTTPDVVLRKLLDFINKTDGELRCIQELNYDGAIIAAAESSSRWARGEPLSIWDGIPVLLKPEDDIVAGLKTNFGRQFEAFSSDSAVATRSGIIANRLIEQGAIIVGSTIMHEMGVQPTGYNPWYGGPHNPYDLRRFPGGSSSGSAVAVATGMVPLAIGWDGGGSIRIPAAWSGAVGLAPTYGRIPYGHPEGLFGVPNMASVVKAGPLTNCVQDAGEALLLLGKTLTVDEGKYHHPFHVSYGGEGPPPPHLVPRWASDDKSKPTRRIRVGVYPEWASHRPSGPTAGQTLKDDAVYRAYERALTELKASSLNAEIVNFTMPHMHRQALSHGIMISAIFSFLWSGEAFDGGTSSLETKNKKDDLQPATYIQLQIGRQVTGMEYVACLRIRAFALSQWRALFLRLPNVDVILTPTVPMTAAVRPSGSDRFGFTDQGLLVQLMRYIWPANLVGLPSLAVPAGIDAAGLPVSLQVICLHWQEADCLAVGHEIEQIFKKERPMPPKHFFVDLLSL